MKHIRIPDKDGKGYYSISTSDDFEYVEPVEHFFTAAVSSYAHNIKGIATMKYRNIPPEFFDKAALKMAIEWAREQMHQITSTPVPDNLIKLLVSKKKNEQEQLLKGVSLTTDELISFICYACAEYGFTFSQYSAHHNPKDFAGVKMPRLAHIDEGKIHKIGDTSLSDGQLKHIINLRSVTISKFIDKGDKWHCFFLTYKSLKGEETGEKPHLHYISHAWGLTRKQVLEQLKSKSYKLPPTPHIDFHTHRNPKPK